MFEKLFKSKDPIASFWQWFQANDEALLSLMPENVGLWREVKHRLKLIESNLTFELNVPDSPPREFIVSADGVKAAFGAVKRTVAMAPPLPNWNVLAFRQPGKDFPEITMGADRLEADQIYYRAIRTESQLHLRIYLRGLTEENRQQMTHMTFLILDSWFGEYDVESKLIVGEDFRPLEGDIEDLKPMACLADDMKDVAGLNL